MIKFIALKKSTNPAKKYDVFLNDAGAVKKVSFGAAGYSDFTQHKEEERKQRYLARHQANEDWASTGLLTAGFWSRWLLWHLPTVRESLDDVVRRFRL